MLKFFILYPKKTFQALYFSKNNFFLMSAGAFDRMVVVNQVERHARHVVELSQVEFTDDGSTFHALPDVPTHSHCVAVLDNRDIFVAGGVWLVGNRAWSQSCFLFESDVKRWKRCPDMMEERSNACCGVVKRRDGKEEVVVAGGYDGRTNLRDTVAIFSIEESSWTAGGHANITFPSRLYSWRAGRDANMHHFPCTLYEP
jgi:hypothetical protein